MTGTAVSDDVYARKRAADTAAEAAAQALAEAEADWLALASKGVDADAAADEIDRARTAHSRRRAEAAVAADRVEAHEAELAAAKHEAAAKRALAAVAPAVEARRVACEQLETRLVAAVKAVADAAIEATNAVAEAKQAIADEESAYRAASVFTGAAYVKSDRWESTFQRLASLNAEHSYSYIAAQASSPLTVLEAVAFAARARL